MENKYENKFKELIIQEIQNQYTISEVEAAIKLNESIYEELLQMDREYVYHYPPTYWAKRFGK